MRAYARADLSGEDEVEAAEIVVGVALHLSDDLIRLLHDLDEHQRVPRDPRVFRVEGRWRIEVYTAAWLSEVLTFLANVQACGGSGAAGQIIADRLRASAGVFGNDGVRKLREETP